MLSRRCVTLHVSSPGAPSGAPDAVDSAPMRHLADVAWKVALALAVVFLLGYFAATRAGTLAPHQVRAVVAGMGFTWLGSCAAVFLLGWWLLAPLARALDAAAPLDRAVAQQAARAASRLPNLAASSLVVLGMGSCALSVSAAFVGRRLPFDVGRAVFGIGAAVTLLAVMTARAVCGREAEAMIERLLKVAEKAMQA